MSNPNIPVYKLALVPEIQEAGAAYVALVDEPAIARYFLKFKEQKETKLLFASEEQRIICGPAMIPDFPIYRTPTARIPENHYVVFDADTIRQVLYKFCKDGKFNNVNLMHEPGTTPADVYLIESFISDSTRGIAAPEAFKDLPDGTWYMSYKVDNPAIWDKVKDGTFNGFSIEGLFSYVVTEESPEEQLMNQIIKEVESWG